jgi:hypothetical protein
MSARTANNSFGTVAMFDYSETVTNQNCIQEEIKMRLEGKTVRV